MIFRTKPVTMSGAPRSKAAPGALPSASTGPRFGHLRMGRELPKSALGKSPAIARAAASKPAVSAEQAQARVSTVFASEHSIGRERQAADMLQTRMSAAEITDLLSKQPKYAGAASNAVLARLTGQRNPMLEPSSDSDHS